MNQRNNKNRVKYWRSFWSGPFPMCSRGVPVVQCRSAPCPTFLHTCRGAFVRNWVEQTLMSSFAPLIVKCHQLMLLLQALPVPKRAQLPSANIWRHFFFIARKKCSPARGTKRRTSSRTNAHRRERKKTVGAAMETNVTCDPVLRSTIIVHSFSFVNPSCSGEY